MRRTLASYAQELAPRSLWLERLRSLAGAVPLDEWLVEEANARGYLGASGPALPERCAVDGLEDEDVIVALLSPHAAADGRIFKLVVRMIQSGKLDARRLAFRARRERADRALYWLLELVPEPERTGPVTAVLRALGSTPRGYRPLGYRYDASRLVRRPAGRGTLWRAPRS